MTRKPSPTQSLGASGVLPKQFPKLPEDLIWRSESPKGWQEADDWWYDVMSVIQSDTTELRQKLNAMAKEIADLKAQLASPNP